MKQKIDSIEVLKSSKVATYVTIILFCLQGEPDVVDIAPLVVANCDKLDLERFYSDLPKYFPYLSPTACDYWKNFKSVNPSVLALGNITWELPTLVSAAILSSQSEAEQNHAISDETLRLLDKEVTAPKPVSSLAISLLLAWTT